MYFVQAMHTTLSLRLYARRNCMITRLSSNSPISGICRDHQRASTCALRERSEKQLAFVFSTAMSAA